MFNRLPVPKVTYLVELLCLGKMDLRCSRVLFYCDQIRGYHQIRELHKVISKHIALSRPSATVCPNIKTFYHPPPSSRPSNNRLQQLKTNCQIILSKPNILSTPQSHKDYFIIHSSLAIKSVKVQVWRKKKKILKKNQSILQVCSFSHPVEEKHQDLSKAWCDHWKIVIIERKIFELQKYFTHRGHYTCHPWGPVILKKS